MIKNKNKTFAAKHQGTSMQGPKHHSSWTSIEFFSAINGDEEPGLPLKAVQKASGADVEHDPNLQIIFFLIHFATKLGQRALMERVRLPVLPRDLKRSTSGGRAVCVRS